MPSNRANEVPGSQQALAGRYLTFRSGNESYGIRVLTVREIIRQAPITAVPQMPAHLRGVLNLRGRIVPVIDLKRRFGLGAAEIGDRTCIIVVQVNRAAGGSTPMGLIVDAVEEVAQITPEDVAATPDFGLKVDTSFLLGMAKVRGEVKALLNLDRILTDGEIQEAAAAAESTPDA